MRGLWFRTQTQNSKKKFMLLGLLDLPLVWFFAKMSVSCLSGHLSARLSPDICINFFFFFFFFFGLSACGQKYTKIKVHIC